MTATPGEIDQQIWLVVTMVPPGKVATYGDIARHAGMPGAARRVGRALRGLPDDTAIPWHRVVNAQGKISIPAGNGARLTQQRRLANEGINFATDTRVSLKQYRWQPGQVTATRGRL